MSKSKKDKVEIIKFVLEMYLLLSDQGHLNVEGIENEYGFNNEDINQILKGLESNHGEQEER